MEKAKLCSKKPPMTSTERSRKRRARLKAEDLAKGVEKKLKVGLAQTSSERVRDHRLNFLKRGFSVIWMEDNETRNEFEPVTIPMIKEDVCSDNLECSDSRKPLEEVNIGEFQIVRGTERKVEDGPELTHSVFIKEEPLCQLDDDETLNNHFMSFVEPQDQCSNGQLTESDHECSQHLLEKAPEIAFDNPLVDKGRIEKCAKSPNIISVCKEPSGKKVVLVGIEDSSGQLYTVCLEDNNPVCIQVSGKKPPLNGMQSNTTCCESVNGGGSVWSKISTEEMGNQSKFQLTKEKVPSKVEQKGHLEAFTRTSIETTEKLAEQAAVASTISLTSISASGKVQNNTLATKVDKRTQRQRESQAYKAVPLQTEKEKLQSKRKAAARRMREYRARKETEREASRKFSRPTAEEKLKAKRAATAERQRRFRARKEAEKRSAEKLAEQAAVLSAICQTLPLTNSELQHDELLDTKQTTALQIQVHKNIPQVLLTEHEKLNAKRALAAERQRRFRARREAEKLATKSSATISNNNKLLNIVGHVIK